MSNNLILITSYYEPINEDRKKEIMFCLEKNNNNPLITEIILMNDREYELEFLENKEKIKQVIISSERLYFKQAIEYSNNFLNEKIVILSNSDIFFDETLSLIPSELNEEAYSLCRYEYKSEIEIKEPGSEAEFTQDVWIFKPKFKLLNKYNFKFGVPGCDNAFTYLLYKEGYKVKNPGKSIRVYHYHNSDYRTYTSKDRVISNYLFIKNTEISERPTYIFKSYDSKRWLNGINKELDK